MKKVFCYIAIVCCFCSIGGGCAGFSDATEEVIVQQNIQEVKTLEEAWMQALVKKDTVTMSSILSEDFVLSGSSEWKETRQQYLQTAAMPDRNLEPLILSDRDLRSYAETVISTGKTFYTGTWKNRSFEFPVRYTHVFLKINGRWKAVAAHISMID